MKPLERTEEQTSSFSADKDLFQISMTIKLFLVLSSNDSFSITGMVCKGQENQRLTPVANAMNIKLCNKYDRLSLDESISN